MPSRPSPPPGLLYVRDTDAGPGIASRLGVRPGTIRAWRMNGRGPRTWHLNGRIVSSVQIIDEYLANQAADTARGAV